jgi:hypothetical protein
MIPVFEWEKTVHALDRAVTVIGYNVSYISLISFIWMPAVIFITAVGK